MTDEDAPLDKPTEPSALVGGAEAERFVASRIRCPSCASQLRELPPNYPLYDVECTRCVFRAQVKRIAARPRDRIRGASWDILNHHLRTGHLLPPIFACFDWPPGNTEPSVILFYPLIPASVLQRRTLSERHKTPGRRMAEYVGMRSLPHFQVWKRAGH